MNKKIRNAIIFAGMFVVTVVGIKLSEKKEFNELKPKQQKEKVMEVANAADYVKVATKNIVDQEFDKAMKNLDVAENILKQNSSYFSNTKEKIEGIELLRTVAKEYMHFSRYYEGTLFTETYSALDSNDLYALGGVTTRIGSVINIQMYNDLKNLLDLAMRTHNNKDKKVLFDVFTTEKEGIINHLEEWLKKAKSNKAIHGPSPENSFFIQLIEQTLEKYKTF